MNDTRVLCLKQTKVTILPKKSPWRFSFDEATLSRKILFYSEPSCYIYHQFHCHPSLLESSGRAGLYHCTLGSVVITYSRVQINRKVANPVHMISWSGKNFLVPVHAWKFGFARQVWPSRPVSACSFSIITLNLVLTQGIPPNVRSGVHIYLRPYTIGSVTTLQA